MQYQKSQVSVSVPESIFKELWKIRNPHLMDVDEEAFEEIKMRLMT